MSPEVIAWTTFALSLIGALAWIPAIIEWLRKPDVQIVSGDHLEVSYFEFGGVLNVPCSLAALDQAALLESFALSAVHEDGRRFEFDFVGQSDTTTAQSSSGERVHWDRQSRANALVLGKDTAADRLVMFRERTHNRTVQEFWALVVPVWERLKANHGDGWREEMRCTKEFDDWLRLVRDGQPWRRGRYTCVMTVNVRQLKRPVEHRFTFDLTDADVRALQSNVQPLLAFVSSVLLSDPPNAPHPNVSFAFPARRTGNQLPARIGSDVSRREK